MGLREITEIRFGKRVREERERQGLSQDELARLLCARDIPVVASTIAKVEAPRKPRAVRLGEAVALADIFDVSLDYLLGRKQVRAEDEIAPDLRVLRDTAKQHAVKVRAALSAVNSAVADLPLENDVPGEVAEIWSALEETADDACNHLTIADGLLDDVVGLADQMLAVLDQPREI